MHPDDQDRGNGIDTDEVIDESTPLVGERSAASRRPHHGHHISVASVASSVAAKVKVPKVHSTEAIINIISVITVVSASAGGFAGIPTLRLVEDAVCHQYYQRPVGEPIDEKLCKVDSVQSETAFILAIAQTLDAIAGLLAAFPWGIAADRIGRKLVFSLALIGMTLGLLWAMTIIYFQSVIPVKFIWVTSIMMFLGGGNAALNGVIGGIVCDVAPEEKRAVSFMRIHVASLVGNLVSPALASTTMQAVGPWATLWVSVACLMFGAVTFNFVPETLQHDKQSDDQNSSGDSSSSSEPMGFKARVLHAFDRFRESLTILKSPSLILLLITSLGSNAITASILNFMIQFISKRYDIAIEKTGYIQSTYGLAQVFLALLLLPAATRYLMKDSAPKALRMDNEQQRDLWLARCSYGFLILGSLLLGLAPTLAVFVLGMLVMALGSGYSGFIRSLMSMYVDPEHQSRLFTLVSMIEAIGIIYAGPMLAALFTLGMRFGGGWIGLPYYGISCICAVVLAILVFVRVPKREVEVSSVYEGVTHED